jgi:RHS repeat-associated protein
MQKSIAFSIFLLVCNTVVKSQTPRTVPTAYGSTYSVNYVRSWQALAPDQDPNDLITRAVRDVHQNTDYFDGIGRPTETVIKGITPAGNDMVAPIIYDNMGREQFSYLPSPSTVAQTGDIVNDGNFKIDPFQQQAKFYSTTGILTNQGETFFYGQSIYEASPLNRIVSAFPAGTSWCGASKGSLQEYFTNTVSDNVQEWTVNASYTNIPNSPAPVPINNGAYPAGTLFKNIVVDESGNQVVEFKDRENKTILKQVQFIPTPGTNHSGWLNTYYIYDNLNNLRYVLQPQAVQLLLNNSTWNLSAISNLMTGLCFYYEYDQRNRMIIKQEPGAKPVYMVYDARDRLVMTQDGNLRAAGKWLVTVYENNLNRAVQTGLLTDATSFSAELSNAYNSITYPSTVSNFELLTQTWFDTYTWQTGTPLSAGFDASQSSSTGFLPSSDASYPYPRAVSKSTYTTLGLVTGSKKEILGTSNYLYTTSYYDDRDRIIQVQTTNITGGTDETTNQYSFDGKILISQLKSVKSGTNAQTNIVQSQMSYDANDRITSIAKIFTGVAGNFTKTMVNYAYNELGKLLTKTLGPSSGLNSGPVDVLTFDYNIRGWLLGTNRNYINSGTTIAITNAPPAPGNYFGEELAYDKLSSMSGMTYTAAQLNGNIAGTVWKSTGDAVNRKYDFVYDPANRLSAANFSQITPSNAQVVDFSVGGLGYDANGNITQMNQNGYRLGAPTAPIDQLIYSYLPTSNQLQNVSDGANNSQTILGDFRYSSTYSATFGGTKPTTAVDYVYDDNGNLATDLNKDIGTSSSKGILYNYLNLPQLITLANNKGTIQYTYDASGEKLQKIVTENNGSVVLNGTSYTNVAITTTTTYINGLVFQSISYPNNATLNSSILQHGDILQFIGQEEGRIRGLYYNTTNSNAITGYAVDYIIKDHLGNIRMVLTDEQYSDPLYDATMETAALVAEQKIFGNDIQTPKPSGFDTNSGNQFVAVTNYPSQKIGPSLILKVMAGDQLSMQVDAYYLTTSGNNYNVAALVATDLLTNLISTTGIPGAGGNHATLADLQGNTSVLNTSTQNYLNARTAPNPSVPKAYLNYVFLDDQFQYAGGYATPITSACATAAQTILAHNLSSIAAPKNGYVYVFVSNESNYNVYFDNLKVSYAHGPILEDNAYYPFGLTMAGISDKAIKYNYAENKYKFGGKELQNKEFSDGSGLEDYDYGARTFDPQLGRWNQQDPLSDKFRRHSTYCYSVDNPVRFIDPNGTNVEETSEGTLFTGNDVLAVYGILTGKTKNVFIQILGDWRTAKNEKAGTPYGSAVRAQTAKSNSSGVYGEWSVFAVTDFIKAELAIASFINISNLEISTEGQLTHTSRLAPYNGVGIGYHDINYENGDFITTKEINNYLSGAPQEKVLRANIVSLQNILLKVKSGGNAIIAACQAGYSFNNSTVGSQFGLALNRLSGERLTFYLSTGYSNTHYDQADYFNAGGMRIGGSQTGLSKQNLPAGWLRYNSQGSTLMRDVIINLSGSPVEFR